MLNRLESFPANIPFVGTWYQCQPLLSGFAPRAQPRLTIVIAGALFALTVSIRSTIGRMRSYSI